MLRLSLRGVGSVVDVEEWEGRILAWKDGRLLGGYAEPKYQSE